MTGRLGVGVVGLGAWGEVHVQAWQGLPLVQVSAVCSRDPVRAQDIAHRFGVDRCYGTPEELTADPDVEIVSVVNHEQDHQRAVLAAVAQRKPVLVEKPIATSLDDARAMIDAARAASVPLMPAHLLRFDARLATVKDRLVSGDLGEMASIYARRLIPRDRYATYQRTHPALNAAIHDVDLALWFADSRPKTVRAYERNVQGGAAPDVLWATIEFASGALAVLENLWLVPVQAGVWLDAETEIVGSRGMARVRFPSDALSLWLERGPSLPDTMLASVAQGAMSGALCDQFAYFARCIAAGVPPARVTGEDALRALELTLAIIDSAAAGRELRLD
ncbi:MAG: Gfo/Idh/MocA family oxidoreductase [Chloroflexi bacterium]|nr:Gfo/Idh/MocA family oxidoreductase [Chloroflexota bacterium]